MAAKTRWPLGYMTPKNGVASLPLHFCAKVAKSLRSGIDTSRSYIFTLPMQFILSSELMCPVWSFY